MKGIALVSPFQVCTSNQRLDKWMQTKKAHTPLHGPFCRSVSLSCLYIGRVIEGAVTGSLLLRLPLPGILVVSRGGKKQGLDFTGRGKVLTMHYPLLAVVREGCSYVGELDKKTVMIFHLL